MKLRYIVLLAVIAFLTPYVIKTVAYAMEVKSTYDQVQKISQTDVVQKLASRRN